MGPKGRAVANGVGVQCTAFLELAPAGCHLAEPPYLPAFHTSAWPPHTRNPRWMSSEHLCHPELSISDLQLKCCPFMPGVNCNIVNS